ncbi:cytochrome c oxidase subunit NDUFA4-like [Uloborus diversus]|uniref:cytochrome c oxidase subunit NDUFA4-like n=1 Tax=Uloborus diversus TaxID=327109 RepID=UPI0024092FD0|nr:cytochrome c oxidase subunit NDUFA4-like [Uloborus diversus]
MKGMTLSSLKKHYSLIPLFVMLAGGMTLSAAYLARLAFKNPEVSWRRSSNPEPWQEYADKRYKLYHSKGEMNTQKIKEERPEF